MKTINVNEILFRCSALGKIMTEPQGRSNLQKYFDKKETLDNGIKRYDETKNKDTKTAIKLFESIERWKVDVANLYLIKDEVNLSETCKKYLADIFIKEAYGRERHLENKYIIKGLEVEEDSLTLYSRVSKLYYTKNETHFTNKYIKGTPDIIAGTPDYLTIVDIKSSWDIFTFFEANTEDINDLYYWQLQGYMALTGAVNAKLIYCLVDTPMALLNDEKRRLLWKMNVLSEADENYIEACNNLDKLCLYSDIPNEQKIKEIIVNRNDNDIDRLYSRVAECRKYLEKTFIFNFNESN